MYDLASSDLIDFATRWASLGDVVTRQVEKILDNAEDTTGDVNPAAIRLARERLQGANAELDDAFEVYFESLSQHLPAA